MKLGKLQKSAYEFAKNYPGWHTYSQDFITRRTIESLVKKGLVETNKFNQFILKSEEKI